MDYPNGKIIEKQERMMKLIKSIKKSHLSGT